MTPLQKLLDKLSGTRSLGGDRWQARCPAHDDRHPSLSIRELSDGAVVLHCFAGCANVDVVESVGLSLSDLYPPRRPTTYPPSLEIPRLPPIPASDALGLLSQEATTVYLIATRLAQGEHVALYAQDLRRAAFRIRTIYQGWMEAPR